MSKCTRPECGNELKKGKLYCSSRCAAKDRTRLREQAERVMSVPSEVTSLLVDKFGENGQAVVEEINLALEDKSLAVIPFPSTGITYGEWTLSFDGKKDYRPSDRLDYETIEMMLKSGPVIFAMEMKRAQVFKVFSEGRFKVDSPDKELAEIASASLRLIMPKMASDFTYSAFAYGTSFQEEIWGNRTRYELGLSEEKDNQTFTVPFVPNSVKPSTVDHIRRDKKQKFDGFVQKRNDTYALSGIDEIVVDKDAALVIPFNEHFRNLWGDSFLKALYPIWLWYEITLRTMARYLERMAMPVVVARAPSRSSVLIEGKTTPVRAMDLALALAGNVAKSNAVAIPSDRDENGNYLWELNYLTATEKGQAFIQVLEFFQQEMIRAGLSADRSLSQSSGGVGSYNIGELHAQASSLTSEMILQQFVYYLNEFFMPSFSLYNRGKNGPPIWLKTQAIDLAERQLLMSLIAVAGSTPAGQEFFWQVDWGTLGEISNIPLLDEEEMKERKAEVQQEQMDKMEQQQKIMAQNAAPVAKGGASAFPEKDAKKAAKPADKQDGSSNNPALPIKNEQALALESVFTHHIPWMLSEHEAHLLVEKGALSEETLKLFQKGEFDEGKVKRGDGGRFAKKEGTEKDAILAEVDAVIAEARKQYELAKKNMSQAQIEAMESFFADLEENRSAINAETLNFMRHIPEGLALISKEAPTSPEELFSELKSEYEALGVDVRAESVRPMTEEEITSHPNAGGLYDSSTNTMTLHPAIWEDVKKGDLRGAVILSHEILHSDQETDRPATEKDFTSFKSDTGETIRLGASTLADSQNQNEILGFMKMAEGQNELLNRYVLSKRYGVELTSETMKAHDGIKSIDNPDYISRGYGIETEFYAKLVKNASEREGRNPIDILIEQHRDGFDMAKERQFLSQNYGRYDGEFKSPYQYYLDEFNSNRDAEAIKLNLSEFYSYANNYGSGQ